MFKMKIIITPISAKRLELSQTLESLLIFYQPFCSHLKLDESKKLLTITAAVEDREKLKEIAESHEFSVLMGALSTLSKNTDIQIKDINTSLQHKYLHQFIQELSKIN
jgi:hypothetical protein